MLIYVNSFLFEPEQGPEQIIQLVAKWVGKRANSYVDGARLAEGIRELTIKDGSTLSSHATVSDGKQKIHPYFFCAWYSHRDEKTAGRKWGTEIGLHQEAEDKPVECSVLVKTDEVSARVSTPIQTTRPKLVEQLITSCKPLGKTPGLNVKRLDKESAQAFLREVEHKERNYSIVVMSPNRDSQYPVEPERLRSILVGLADLVVVPVLEDTFAIEEIVSRRYMAFGGALNIIFPLRDGYRAIFCESVLTRPDQIVNILQSGKSIESEVLAAITHRTNLPHSWRHISPEKVNQAIFRARFDRMIERAKASDRSDELKEYIDLLELADHEQRTKDNELVQIRSAYEKKDQEVRVLQADIYNLKHALSGKQSSDDKRSEIAEIFAPLRKSIADVLRTNPCLQQVVRLIAMLYSERVVFLDSAESSAKESDHGGFRQGAKACELLLKLVTDYWQQIANGDGDQQAKKVFGQNAYATNEASALSNEGKRRRTYNYNGREFFMEKHLKLGVKDSAAETLRVHFEWLAHEKRIVIGHCGKHLDF